MRNMVGFFHVLLVLLLVSIHQTHASNSGASVTSCYTHFIYHTRFGILEAVLDCDGSNPNCRSAVLTVMCGSESDPYCCDGLNLTSGKRYLYTMCNYTLQWNSVPNLGYLIQARVDPDHSRVFSNTSEIVGTWTPNIGNKILYCNSSMQAGESASPLPNSITHTQVYTSGDVDRPPALNMTWRANSTLTSSNQQIENSINITFFYTISRDVSTNFFPYTREDLSFELRAPPPPTDPPTNPPTTTPMDPTTKPTTNPPTRQPTDPSTNPPTDPLTSLLTDPPTNPPTDPTTNLPTDPPTTIATDPLTNPPTIPPTDTTTNLQTDQTTTLLTDPPTNPPTDPLTNPSTDPPTSPSTDLPTNPLTNPSTNLPIDQTTNPLTDPRTNPPMDLTTNLPTDPPTRPPTDPPTDPPMDPTSNPITVLPTNPPTDPPTNPPTNPPITPTTNPPTDPPTNLPTDLSTNLPTDPTINPPIDPFTSQQTGVPSERLTKPPHILKEGTTHDMMEPAVLIVFYLLSSSSLLEL